MLWTIYMARIWAQHKRSYTITSTMLDVMLVYNEQANLGWNHFIRGRMLIQWGTIINNHLEKKSKYKFKAEHWRSKLLSINWKYILKLWIMRNTEVKGETPVESEVIRRDDMINDILHLQSLSGHLPRTAQDIVFIDATALRNMKTSTISAHLYAVRMLIESSRTHQTIPGQQSITDFFQRSNRTPNTLHVMDTDTATDTIP
jgi:hypothetical protein